ncbi:hypothetical protein MUG10_19115 [Xanthomonas prunicola]|uniref:ATP-grasp domain-containing protein n=1 Tax=Xanthomonas prunicola TaxID=2053930 RepID=UPI002078B0D4|nr:hypothetical protein [Xanthomonas prunicola]USJ00058.1 hypothetical protein MUG10_19115 [Xanthomonas prunicola]
MKGELNKKEKPVLILSEVLDYHGIAVKWGLEGLNVPVVWWERSMFPYKQEVTSGFGDSNKIEADSLDLNRAYKSIWNRRGGRPIIDPKLHSTDKIAAKNESDFLLEGLCSVLEANYPETLVINSFSMARRANSKIFQINVAQRAGFKIPETLISNSPAAIKDFSLSHPRGMIAKMHFPFAWRDVNGVLLITGTSLIIDINKFKDSELRSCPMIYQEKLEIDWELRVIVFGNTAFAIAQRIVEDFKEGFCDIRYAKTEKRVYVVPSGLLELCKKYMMLSSLSYAAFDVALMNDGSFVFIEANESGQFLYLEREFCEIPLLDAFCQFLFSGDASFVYSNPTGITLKDFDSTEDSAKFELRYNEAARSSSKVSPFELNEAECNEN